ncbi:serine hydrolase [Candidatus Parcubacteria bacterium]|nr:serine hydrolase [Candidatus Parcubacteria bacterium]
MIKNTFFIILLAICVLSAPMRAALAVNKPSDQPVQEKIQAILAQIKYLQGLMADLQLQEGTVSDSYVVMDLSNGSLLSSKNPNQAFPLASITKLMNAVVALENVDTNQTVTLTSDMLKPEGYSPSLFENLTVSVNNLLRASLIQSVNDAAESISYTVGNPKFLSLMNQKAKELGMDNTVFYDVHGLNVENHSTASDLSKLISYIYNRHPEILTITKDNNFWLPDPTGKLLKFQNLNNFYNSPEFVGGKTGYLVEAKQAFASVFNLKGKPIAIVLLHSISRQKDTVKIIDWVKNNPAI